MYKCYNTIFRAWLFIFSPFENRFKPYRQHQIYVYYYSWYQFGYQLFGLFYKYLLMSGIHWHWDIIASPFCDTKCLSFVEYFFLCTKNYGCCANANCVYASVCLYIDAELRLPLFQFIWTCQFDAFIFIDWTLAHTYTHSLDNCVC